MDRKDLPRGRLAWLGASMLAASLAGCSYMKGFRAGEAPRVGGYADPAVDPYLVHHKVGTRPTAPAAEPSAAPAMAQAGTPAEAAFVRSTAHPTAPAGSPEEGPVPTEVVSLGAPVALPTASRPGPVSPAPARVADSSTEVAGLRGPATSPAPSKTDDARSVIDRARAAVDAMASYQVQLSRQERVGDALQPAEDVQLSIRKEPRAVRIEWPAGAHKGREVLYSASEPGGMLHVHAGDSPIPVPNLTFPLDSPMVMRNSRHPITEAGLDSIIATLERNLETPVPGASLNYGGVETPDAVGRPCHKVERHTPAGETWLVYLDAATHFPALVHATAANGDLLEHYVFRDVKPNPPELASADAFDPAKRWSSGGAGGLLGRLTRTSAGDAKTADTPAPR